MTWSDKCDGPRRADSDGSLTSAQRRLGSVSAPFARRIPAYPRMDASVITMMSVPAIFGAASLDRRALASGSSRQ